MKKIFSLSLLILIAAFTHAQGPVDPADKSGHEIPNVQVEDLTGNTVQTGELSNDGKPMIISFWATWCKPCVLELNTIHDEYEDWVEETGVKLVAISIDDARNKHKVSPFVNGKGWEYEVLIDENGDFKRAMGVNNVPHTFLVDGHGNIVWQHNSFSPGDEEELREKLVELQSVHDPKPPSEK